MQWKKEVPENSLKVYIHSCSLLCVLMVQYVWYTHKSDNIWFMRWVCQGDDCSQVADRGYWEVAQPKDFQPEGSASHAAVVWRDSLYIVGGESYNRSQMMYIYDFTGEWRKRNRRFMRVCANRWHISEWSFNHIPNDLGEFF